MRCAFAAALPAWQGVLELEVPEASTVVDVLARARDRLQTIAPDALEHDAWHSGTVGIFGVVCERTQTLRSGDRVELYLPLSVDPKEARRARARAR